MVTPTAASMAASERPQLFIDFMSQPARALWLFVQCNNLPVDFLQLRISKGEHKSPQALLLNPVGKLPFLQDGEDFRIVESGAIFSYLTTKLVGQVAEHWYPTACIKSRARVESLLHWHHANTRAGASGMVFDLVIGPSVFKQASNPRAAKSAEHQLQASLRLLELAWLAPAAGGQGGPLLAGGASTSGKFLGGFDQPTVADLQVACELEMLSMLDRERDGTDKAAQLEPYPAVRAWLERVAAACGPRWAEAHAVLWRTNEAAKKRSRVPLGSRGSKL